ncbi:hypothetical protein DB808_04730, partial [Xanthomonas perforans]
ENVNISGGRLEEGSQRYLVRTVNQFVDLDEIRNMLVTTQSSSGSAAEAAMQQMYAIAASTGSQAALAAAAEVQRTSTSPAVGWKKARSATWCVRSTSSWIWTRSATCW